ncbi:rhombosortase-dependent M36 family metallopeptidase [Pseudoalteromonas sp. MMG012]|uniref:rhombosortase-dependent M36 family metallopeptidase n=1 Tax=Pseudoalteromonas sp. MMG012 TaxID=2822686 RepID=UPI001B39FD2A|nr:rhombosortase-dependent M36 family metallopeptidase [Pseudoalteromonas sp. MMG012]MBQ4849297.1 rhombosortase-dependent M36 family metallopeptidase [Pseudoalteromonas sp. MMG012]
MNNIPKITLIAASMVTILGTNTASALTYNAQSGLIDQAQINTSSQADQVKAQQQALAAQATVSGMTSHYDKELGKATFVWASKAHTTPNLSNIAVEQRNEFVADHYLQQLTGLKTSKSAILDGAQLTNLHESKRGPAIAKYKQLVGGIEVFNREYNVMIDKEYNLVASSGFVSHAKAANSTNPAFTHFGSAAKAIGIAAKNIGAETNDLQLSNEKLEGQFTSFTAQDASGTVNAFSPRAKKVFFDDGTQLVAAYYVEVEVAPKNSVESEAYGYVIASNSGKVLFKNNLIAHSNDYTYRVYANQNGYPMEGPHGDVLPKLDTGPDKTEIEAAPLVTLSHYSKISTQDPWLAEDATMTSGNNVFAYADVVAPDGFTEGDFSAELTSANTFDYPYEVSQSPTSLNNRKSAIVNLFYMNNFLHDFFYDYGFDEASGNAQLSNYGRGGEENDPLHVQAQDYSGLNNANMSTPADGRSPRMQQYLWNSKDAIVGTDFAVTVTSHSQVGLLQSSKVASFGPVQYDLSGMTVRLNDSTDTATDGCEPATNGAELAGKIALIDRGGCAFTAKAKHAQEAGAIGVIIINNVDDGTPAPMGGTDDSVTVVSMGLSFQDGKKIYDLMDSGEMVTVNLMSTFPLKDSTFDNGIIAHEWGHYISNRLVGNGAGLNNFQGRAMGEGWGDFHSLMFIALESDLTIAGNDQFQLPYATGTFVENFTTGIRRAPYSTDMSVNPLTFKHITSGAEVDGLPPTNGGSPHAAGEVWANMLWNVYVGLINKHGFQEAQDRMATYLISGYKATPISPTYVEARDAILASVYATDMEDFTIALKAFADRGLGLGSIAPPRNSDDNSGVIESNKTTLSAFQATSVSLNTNYNGVELGYCSNDEILDKGETGTLSVSVKNAGDATLNSISAKVVVTSGHNVTLENDGMITFDALAPFTSATSVPLMVTLNEAGTAENLTFEVTFEGEEVVGETKMAVSSTVNYDFKVKAHQGTSALVDMEGYNLFADFKENVMTGGDLAKGTQNFNTSNTAFFSSGNPDVEFGEQTMFLRNNGFESDVTVESKNFEVGFGNDFSISFWHLYLLEDNWDGGVLEISINNGNWVDVTSTIAGGTFDTGYNTTALIENPQQALQNRPAFTGSNFTSQSTGNMEKVSFGDHLNGQTVKFRFRISADGGTAETGWFIDQVKFENVASSQFHSTVAGDVNTCDNVAPMLSAPDSIDVNESATATITASATDRNNDSLTYTWTQIEGPSATLAGNDSATLTVTPPSITEDTALKFELTVSDGSEHVKTATTVNVTNETPPVVTPPVVTPPVVTPPVVTPPKLPDSNSNSSGSMGWFALLFAGAGLLRRRK